MLSLFELVYETLTYNPTYNLLIIGEEESGKTELLQTIKQMNKLEIFSHSPASLTTQSDLSDTLFKSFESTASSRKPYNATIGQNTFTFHFGKSCFVKVWDIGGNLKSMWSDYYQSTHCLFFMIKYQIQIHGSDYDQKSDPLINPKLTHLPFEEDSFKIDLYHSFDSSFQLLSSILKEHKELFKETPIFLCINSVVTLPPEQSPSHELIEKYKSVAISELNRVIFAEGSGEEKTNILYSDEFYRIFIKHLDVCDGRKVYELLKSVTDYLHTQNKARALVDEDFI